MRAAVAALLLALLAGGAWQAHRALNKPRIPPRVFASLAPHFRLARIWGDAEVARLTDFFEGLGRLPSTVCARAPEGSGPCGRRNNVHLCARLICI